MNRTNAVGPPDILARAAAGDGPAFDALIGPLIEPAYRLARTMLGREADARDVVQEATLRAWRKIGNLRDGERVRAWYLAIVVNQCRSWRRTRWWSVLTTADTRSADDRAGWEATELRQAIQALAPSDRAAIYLHFYLDLTVEEVAEALRVSPSAARSRIYRAVGRIRPDFDPEGL